MLNGVIDEVVREHIELAAFQWMQRTMLAAVHPADAETMADIDARLAANLDAVEIAGDAAWPIILDRFEDFAEAGELFVASYLAMVRGDKAHIDHCCALAHQNPDSRLGLSAALARFPPDVSGPTVRRMLTAGSGVVRACAVEVLTHYKADAGSRLEGFLADPSVMVRAAACALAAATGRADCAGVLSGYVTADHTGLRFAAMEALAGLGRADIAIGPLKTEAESDGPRNEEALRILSRTLGDADFRAYLGQLYARDHTRALAVRGIGMTGDRRHLDWLIKQMEVPETAVAAGESFLELFPEAREVDGLFEEDAWPLAAGVDKYSEPEHYPVSRSIEKWAASQTITDTIPA